MKHILALSILIPLLSMAEPDEVGPDTPVDDAGDYAPISPFDAELKKPQATKQKKPVKKTIDDVLSFKGSKKGDACLCRCACPQCSNPSAR